MKRQVNLAEISDGRLYDLNDMVKADCKDCKGCSSCCRGMGKSIILTPLDVYMLTQHLHCTFEQLLKDKLELNVVDGVILPNLKMKGKEEICAFLSEEGRCRIHSVRPGICRIFPLGRYYEGKGFRYFLQTHECKKENRGKIKVKKWIDVPDVKQNEAFILNWHNLLMKLEDKIVKSRDDAIIKNINLQVLNLFYINPYEAEKDFYEQFEERCSLLREKIFPQCSRE